MRNALRMNEDYDALLRDVRRNEPWNSPEEALLIGYLFTKRHFESLQRVFARGGPSEREANALFALADSGPLSQSELRKIMVVATGTISDLLRTMESRNLVSARPSRVDQREKLWKITSKGRASLSSSLEKIYAVLPELFQGFTPDSRDAFLASLRLLRRNAEQLKQKLDDET